MSRDVELVIFDLGRVLVRICDDWEHACDVAGIEVACKKLDESEAASAAEIIGRYDTGRIDLQAFAREIAPLRGLRAEDVVRLNHCYLRGAFPGVDQLLDELHAAGLKTACLSNTAEPHWGMVHDRADPNFLPMDRLTWRFASHLIGHHKPHDPIYEHVERTTGIAPQRIIFFDDLEENVAAAHRRGWQGYRIEIDADPMQQARKHLRAHGVAVAP
jgi:putative hydrolase of the HAD superfamily